MSNLDALREVYAEWGRGRGSGVRVDTKGAHLWRLRGGKAVYLEIFATRERALAAAGLTA
jgi:hypothetical protein